METDASHTHTPPFSVGKAKGSREKDLHLEVAHLFKCAGRADSALLSVLYVKWVASST